MGFKFNPFTGRLDVVNTASTPSGTPDKFAGFDSLGALESINNWTQNTFGGADIAITPTITDPGVTTSFTLNQNSFNLTPTNNQVDTYIYNYLTQISLNGTNDFNAITGHEFAINQLDVSAINSDIVVFFPRINLGYGTGSTSSNSDVIKPSIRLQQDHVAQNINGVNSQVSLDTGATAESAASLRGSTYVGGTTSNAYGIYQEVQIDGTTDAAYGAQIYLRTTFPGNSVNSSRILGLQHDGDLDNSHTDLNISHNGDVGDGLNAIYAYHEGDISSYYNGLSLIRNGANLGGFTGVEINLNTASPTTGYFKFLNLYNEATLGDSGSGIAMFQNGTVTESWTSYESNLNGTFGSGSGNNVNGFNFNINSASTINANVSGFIFYNGADLPFNGTVLNGSNDGEYDSFNVINFNNNGDGTGTGNFYGFSLTNSGTGYSLQGFSFQNTADMTEQFRGVFINNDTADNRTATGIDVNISGNSTDDIQAFRYNVSSATSTNNRVVGIAGQGGIVNIQSAFSPFNGVGVDIGNNLTATATVSSALTGTDTFVTFIQGNLIVQDDISTGPFGLDVSMLGAISQIDISSGKTAPLVRSLLVGTSVPSGSGGTLTEHVVIEVMGLPSFGGSVSNPTRIGIQDSQLLGQNFTDGATDAWFIRVRDEAAENHFGRVAINTTSLKVTNDDVGLEVGGLKTILNPSFTSAQRTAIASPVAGMQIFNTDTSTMEYYDGTNWIAY